MTPYSYYRALDKIDSNLHNLWGRLQETRPLSGQWTTSTLFFASYSDYLDSTDPKIKNDLSRIDYWSNGISAIQRPSLLSIFGVRYLVSERGAPVSAWDGLKLVHRSDADVWENGKALPRAYVVTRPVIVEDDESALEKISAGDFPFDRTAVVTIKLDGAVDATAGQAGDSVLVPADIQKYDREKVRVRASAPQEAWLVLSDLYYPGWNATCDGAPVPIFPGNYLFRAVKIPAGTHVVEYTYRPISFRIGCFLALFAGVPILLLGTVKCGKAIRSRI